MPEVLNRASSALAFWIPAFRTPKSRRLFGDPIVAGMTHNVALPYELLSLTRFPD
jgi:hypothetical protein